jgi:hypothetical protein
MKHTVRHIAVREDEEFDLQQLPKEEVVKVYWDHPVFHLIILTPVEPEYPQ